MSRLGVVVLRMHTDSLQVYLGGLVATLLTPSPPHWERFPSCGFLTRRLEALAATVERSEESARLDIPFDTVPAEVRGDARLFRRLIRNLLENALKHGGVGVEAKPAIDADGDRILRIIDRGPGIPDAERERIFEPFYRPANAAETGSGWGLGLALVRQIAEHHRGTIRCLARERGGCVFELVLPAPDRAV